MIVYDEFLLNKKMENDSNEKFLILTSERGFNDKKIILMFSSFFI